MTVDTLNNRLHVSRSLLLALFGAVLLGLLFSLCWVTAAYGHVRLATQLVHWITADHDLALSALYRGLLYAFAVGAAAGAFVAVLDRVLRKMGPKQRPQPQ